MSLPLGKLQFIEQVCVLLGDSSPVIRSKAEQMFDSGRFGDPHWAAVILMKYIVGPDGMDQVRQMAARFGFDPSQL